MHESLSRRELLVGAAAASTLMPQITNASSPADTPEPAQSAQSAESEAGRLLADARKADADNVAQRMKFSLPENSEPIFTFIPVDRRVRKR